MRARKPVAPVPGRVVGTRIKRVLGLTTPTTAPSTTVRAATPSTLHYVVSKGAALPLMGYHATASKNGNVTLYGVFSTRAAALVHVKANRMGLYTSIVSM